MAARSFLIAIVDDDRSVRMALGSLVRSLGYKVRLFASAEDFLAAEMKRLDCLICDINMPGGMSGWDLRSMMQGTGWVVPTILITAFVEETRQRGSEAGLKIFGKPFDTALMADAILKMVTP